MMRWAFVLVASFVLTCLALRQLAGKRLASMARAKRRWRGGRQEPPDPLEPDRERPLVGEAAGLGDQFARRLRRPGLRHVARDKTARNRC